MTTNATYTGTMQKYFGTRCTVKSTSIEVGSASITFESTGLDHIVDLKDLKLDKSDGFNATYIGSTTKFKGQRCKVKTYRIVEQHAVVVFVNEDKPEELIIFPHEIAIDVGVTV